MNAHALPALWAFPAATPAIPPQTPWHLRGEEFLPHYGLADDSTLKLLSFSENATYRVTDAGSGHDLILRINAPGMRSLGEISSELAWIEALREANVARVAGIVKTQAGAIVSRLEDARPPENLAVAFDLIEGAPPPDAELEQSYREIGNIAAGLHLHGQGWQKPAGFTRPVLDIEHTIGRNGYWGYWADNPNIGPAEQPLLAAVDQKIRRELAAYGASGQNFGLVHGDMRRANLMLSGQGLYLIDFDDCGFSWYLYELACSLSFIEHEADVPAYVAAWLEGYRSRRPLSGSDLAVIPALVMMRRLLLVGWFATHTHTQEAQEITTYAEETLTLAEQFLAGQYLHAALR